MSNLLVTGRWGQTHVTSAQARNFHAGVFGSGQYVLSGLTATMTTANTCHIDPGVACFNGADVEVPAGGEDVTIDNGTQGMMRHDLVVLRYVLDASEQTEDVSLAVVKGTPAASDPQDPAYNSGSILDGTSPCDMPLWRIPLDGVAVGEPEPMYSVLTPAADLMESAAQAASDIDALRDSVSRTPGAGISLASYVSDLGGSHVTRVGTTCYLRLFLLVTHEFAANFNLTTLPADVRPPMWAFTMIEVTTSGVTSHVHGDVAPGGQVIVPKTMKEGDSILVWGAWAVER